MWAMRATHTGLASQAAEITMQDASDIPGSTHDSRARQTIAGKGDRVTVIPPEVGQLDYVKFILYL